MAPRSSAKTSSTLSSSSEKEAARPPRAASDGKREIGNSINYSVFGDVNWAMFPMLQGRPLLSEMDRMAQTDDTIGSVMYCMQTTIGGQVEFKHVPQVDGIDSEGDEEAVRYARFADSLMVDMEESWSDHIDVALRMVPMGTSPCEIVLKQRVGGDESRFYDKFWGIQSLPPRDPLTINQWLYTPDGRRLLGANQMSAGGMIPIEKLLHYRTSANMENPWGTPLFKNAYKPWRLKHKLQDIEALGAERELVGLPVFELPMEVIDTANEVEEDGVTPTKEAIKARNMIAAAQTAVRDTRLSKSSGLLIPSDTYAEDTTGDRTRKFNFRVVTTGGQRSIEIRQPIRDYDRAIARVAMHQFLHLGDRSTGSYAMSDDQSGMAMRSMMFLVSKIVSEWNRKALTYVWRANGFPTKYLPRLGNTPLSKEGMQAIGAMLGGLAKVSGLWETDPDARLAIGKMINIPLDRAAQSQAAKTARKTAETKAEPQQPQLPFGGGAQPENP